MTKASNYPPFKSFYTLASSAYEEVKIIVVVGFRGYAEQETLNPYKHIIFTMNSRTSVNYACKMT